MTAWTEADFKAAFQQEQRDSRAAGKAFAKACTENDVDGLYRAADQMAETVDGWASAMRAVGRLTEIGSDIPAAFLPIWIEKKMLPLIVGNRKTMATALRLLMPSEGRGEPVRLYRGSGSAERRRRLYGFSWTTHLDVARTFAEHWAASDGGAVILETMAPPDAVLLRREVEGYYDEGEVVVDPYRLGRVTVVERLGSDGFIDLAAPPEAAQ